MSYCNNEQINKVIITFDLFLQYCNAWFGLIACVCVRARGIGLCLQPFIQSDIPAPQSAEAWPSPSTSTLNGWWKHLVNKDQCSFSFLYVSKLKSSYIYRHMEKAIYMQSKRLYKQWEISTINTVTPFNKITNCSNKNMLANKKF